MSVSIDGFSIGRSSGEAVIRFEDVKLFQPFFDLRDGAAKVMITITKMEEVVCESRPRKKKKKSLSK